MADSGRSSDRSAPSPNHHKASRSQTSTAATSLDRFDIPEESDESSDLASSSSRAPVPRSHTPGHLASKSIDRRRKPSEHSIRQRSQSASHIASISRSAASGRLPKPPTLSNGSTDGESPREDGKEKRLLAMRSASAMVSRPTVPSSSFSTSKPGAAPPSSSHSSTTAPGPASASASAPAAASQPPRPRMSNPQPAMGKHIPFPPLQDPQDAPDVPAAPASGMYWSKALTSGVPPNALRAHTTTLIGSNIYVFGGCDAGTCFNDLYVLDADSFYWSAPYVVGDVPLPLRAMTCTAVGKKLVVFGGGDGPAYYNDVYVLDTVNFRWSKPQILGDKAPSKRRAHTACLYKNGIYMFGGGDGVRALNDIWRLDVSDTTKMSWKLISGPDRPSAGGKDNRPKGRGYHTANMVGSKLIVFGGSDGGDCFHDVWIYDIEAQYWKGVTIPLTYRRLSHTATLVGSYLFVLGGHDGTVYCNDVLLLNLVTMTWDKRKVYGLPPSGRGYHGTVLYDSRLIAIGGFDGTDVFGDVVILELAVHAYYSQISHFTIEV